MNNLITNESDFRLISYDKETEEALKAFNKEKIKKTHIKDLNIDKKENNIKSQKRNQKNVFFCMSIAIVVFLCFISALSFHVKYNEVNHLYQQLSFELDMNKSENILLNTELDSKISLQNINEYAVEKLKMQKIQKKKIYIDSKDFRNKYESRGNNQE